MKLGDIMAALFVTLCPKHTLFKDRSSEVLTAVIN